MNLLCACGRPVKVHRSVRKKSSRSARAGSPTSLKDHDLCSKCWERLTDVLRAARLAEQTRHETPLAA